MFETFKNEETRRTFNIAFWHGFYVGMLIFIVLNVVAYFYADYIYEDRSIGFSPVSRFEWGFPFSWTGSSLTGYQDGPLNILVLVLFGFVFGFIYKSFKQKD
jgi:hypothetical protein